MLVNQSIGFDSRVLGACGKKKMEQSAREFKTKVETVLARGRNEIYRPDLTKAAVLVPIVFRKNGPHIIVTMRSMKVETHKGQISFPGGVREPEDKNAVDNALRETQEEIGVDPDSVTVMGLLDDIVTSSGFKVTPVVGFVSSEVSYSKDSVEVEEIIEVPISFLRDPSQARGGDYGIRKYLLSISQLQIQRLRYLGSHRRHYQRFHQSPGRFCLMDSRE